MTSQPSLPLFNRASEAYEPGRVARGAARRFSENTPLVSEIGTRPRAAPHFEGGHSSREFQRKIVQKSFAPLVGASSSVTIRFTLKGIPCAR